MPKGIQRLDQKALQTGWPKSKLVKGTPHPDHPDVFYHSRTKKWGEYWCDAEFLVKDRKKIKKQSYERLRKLGVPTREEYSKERNHLDQTTLQTGSKVGSIPRGTPHPCNSKIVLVRYDEKRASGPERWGWLENYEKQKANARKRAKIHSQKPEVKVRSNDLQRKRWSNATPEQVEKRKKQAKQNYTKRKTNGKHYEYVDKPEVKSKLRKNARKHYQEYPELHAAYNKKTYKNRVANGKDREMRERPQYKIAGTLRSRVRRVITSEFKSAATLDLLGCSVEDFMAHIESQFEDWMSWDNYGKHSWHLDHYMPCNFFNLRDPEQQKICFNYANFRPLKAEENWSKRDKLPACLLWVILKHRYRVLTVK